MNNEKFMNLKLLTLILSLIFSINLQAKQLAGIDISESISFSDQSTNLILNGAGIRTKLFFDIYIGSLYLEKKSINPKEIYNMHGEKRISMHFLYDEVSKEKLVNGWNDGFKNNLSNNELSKFKPQINQFNNLFITVNKGDVIHLIFIPTTGTHVIINDKTMGLIEGDAFFTALLKIWLGEDPADSNLKEAMLGVEENTSP